MLEKKETKETKPVKAELIEGVLVRINEMQKMGEITLPPDYKAANALQAAWFELIAIPQGKDKSILETCSKASISNALFNMVVDGLNPARKQCYFIPYGNRAKCVRSYMGDIMLAKRFGGLLSITKNVIYKGDEFTFEIDVETGLKKIIAHKTSIENMNNEVVGAYAIMTLADGTKDTEIMTMQQIKKSWEQGATKGNSPAHKNFPDQMAQKTVLKRAIKLLINTADDHVFFTSSEDETDTDTDYISLEVKSEINNSANGAKISIEAAEVQETLDADIDDAEIDNEPVANENNQATLTGPGF